MNRLNFGPATRGELVTAMKEYGIEMNSHEFTRMLAAMERNGYIQSYVTVEKDGKVEIYRMFYRIARDNRRCSDTE